MASITLFTHSFSSEGRKSSAYANGEVDVMKRALISEPKRPMVNLSSATF